MAQAGERTVLATAALGVLQARGEQPVDRLAALLRCRSDVLLDLLLPLAAAGWVVLPRDGSGIRSTNPVPAPTLQEVLAVEGERTVIDDCALCPGAACRAFDGRPPCPAHADWIATLAQPALMVLAIGLAAGASTSSVTARRAMGGVRSASGRFTSPASSPRSDGDRGVAGATSSAADRPVLTADAGPQPPQPMAAPHAEAPVPPSGAPVESERTP